MNRFLWVSVVLVASVGTVYAAENADFGNNGVVDFNDFVQFAKRYG